MCVQANTMSGICTAPLVPLVCTAVSAQREHLFQTMIAMPVLFVEY